MKLRIRNGIRKVSAWNNVKCTKDILFGRGIICVSVKWPEEKSFLINNWYKGSRVVGTDQGGGEEGSENVQVRQILRCVAIKPPHSSRVTFCIDSGGRCHEQISRLNLYSKLSTSRERKRKKKERERKVVQDIMILEFWTSDFSKEVKSTMERLCDSRFKFRL